MKVNINDKLSKIKTIYEADNIFGTYYCKGKVLENMDDKTFGKSLIANDATILIMVQEKGGGKAKMWRRFPQIYKTDYFYMETYSWDAVAFIPKRNVTFYGFGILASFNNKDMKYKVSWALNDDAN